MISDDDKKTILNLVSCLSESKDRTNTYKVLDEFISGVGNRLETLPHHSCSLLNYSAHDLKRVNDFKKISTRSLERSYLSSFYIQIGCYDKAIELLDSFAQNRKLSLLEKFLKYKCLLLKKNLKKLAEFDFSDLEGLACLIPEVGSDIVARHLLIGDVKSFLSDARLYKLDQNYIQILADVYEFAANNIFHKLGTTQNQNSVGNVIAVYGMRCSGGSALQDYLTDHSCVFTSAGEYLIFSGAYGLRSIDKKNGDPYEIFEFFRHHVFGLTVPVSRTYSRIVRQSIYDKNHGYLSENITAISKCLKVSTNVTDFLLYSISQFWENYTKEDGKKLLLKKLFSSGDFDLITSLPPFLGLMVWRDPRDQYVDQVQRGFVKDGDVETFVNDFRKKVVRLVSGLASASKSHRDLFINVGFEQFVKDESYRISITNLLGLSQNSHIFNNFIPEESFKNIRIWEGFHRQSDFDYISKELSDYMESSDVNPLSFKR